MKIFFDAKTPRKMTHYPFTFLLSYRLLQGPGEIALFVPLSFQELIICLSLLSFYHQMLQDDWSSGTPPSANALSQNTHLYYPFTVLSSYRLLQGPGELALFVPLSLQGVAEASLAVRLQSTMCTDKQVCG